MEGTQVHNGGVACLTRELEMYLHSKKLVVPFFVIREWMQRYFQWGELNVVFLCMLVSSSGGMVTVEQSLVQGNFLKDHPPCILAFS